MMKMTTTLVVSTGTGAESIGGRGSRGKWGSAPMDLSFTDPQNFEKVVDPWRGNLSVLTAGELHEQYSSSTGLFLNRALLVGGSSQTGLFPSRVLSQRGSSRTGFSNFWSQ